MKDNNYREMMITILTHLAPRFELKGSMLVNELDEYGEIIFVHKGCIGVGYEINKNIRIPL